MANMVKIPGSRYIEKTLMTLWKLKLVNSLESNCGVGEYCEKFYKKGVVLVGSNPSNKSPDNSAFHPDTKSRKFVDNWFDNSWSVVYTNLVDFKTENNKQLSKTQIKDNMPDIVHNISFYNIVGYRIVACGKVAATGLKMAGVDFFEMPHPSGLCRFWNDKEAGEAKVEEMKKWIQR